MKRAAFLMAMVLGAAALAGGCSSSAAEGDSSESAASANPEDLKECRIFVVKDQKFVDLKAFVEDRDHPERKNDPVLQKLLAPVLEGKGCPKSYQEMQKLESIKSCDLQTRIVSERTALTSQPDEGRALASRQCGDEPTMFFLLDPVDTRTDEIPEDVEVMGNNGVDGVFTYYAHEPVGHQEGEKAVWKFFGTSSDFVTNGYDCSTSKFHGACQSKLAQDDAIPENKSGVRCASCHPGGGMVQKELNSPWTNWMQDPNGYVSKHADMLGRFQDGDSFEGTTQNLNTKWAKKRADILAKKSVKELLRPVFCTMDINLQAGRNSARADLMIDLLFANPGSFFGSADSFGGIGGQTIGQLQPENYKAAIEKLGQKIDADFGGKTFGDTPDPFMYPERSNLDHQYVAALKNNKLVSEDLIRDILFVDFTRPIFSPTRCSLVDLADGITDASKAKDAFISKIEAKGSGATSAEKEFLASLKAATPASGGRHQAEVDAYLKTCRDRSTSDNAGFTTDVVAYASHLRQVSKLLKVKLRTEEFELGIIDFDETLPKDSLWDQTMTDPKFDPATCKLTK